jgi:hypothetical protein
MKTEDEVVFRLYKSGDLSEAQIQKIWFPTDASGALQPTWTIDYGLQEQLLLEACYRSHTALIDRLLTPILLDYCAFDTIEEVLDVAQDLHLLSVLRFYVEYSICDLNEVLYWACKQPSLDEDAELRAIFNMLMKNDTVNKAFESNLCIGAAAKYGNLYAVNALLACAEVDPSDYSSYALSMASKYGHLDVVERLLRHSSVCPSDDDNRAIRLACKYHHTHVVRLLLENRKVDPSCMSNVCMKHAVEFAVDTGNHDLVIALLADDRVEMSNSQILSLLERTEIP